MFRLPSKADLIEADREIVRRGGLYAFLQIAWSHVVPDRFVDNWHIQALCYCLEAVSDGRIRRLVVNIPPGTGKSLTTDVFWWAWHSIAHPESAWLFASCDDKLVYRDAKRAADLVRSDWFKERWSELIPGRADPNVSDYRTKQGGHRFGTTPHGKAIGHHFDIHSIGDPIKPQSTMHYVSAELAFVEAWHSQTLATRYKHLPTSRDVVTMQRLHEDDLAGHCIARGYTLLSFPMRYEGERHCTVYDDAGVLVCEDQRSTEGELLFHERFPETDVAELEKTLGDAAPAQLQQNPMRKGGNAIQDVWISANYWSHNTLLTNKRWPDSRFSLFFISADLAFKGKATSDFVAFGEIAVHGLDIYFGDLFCERVSFVESCEAFVKFAEKHPLCFDKLVENKANGPALEDQLKRSMSGIVLVEPDGGKEARLYAAQPAFKAGNVHFQHPDENPLTLVAFRQLTRFPFITNDDLMDMATQAINEARKHGSEFSAAMARARGET